jgi:hypothetical protein
MRHGHAPVAAAIVAAFAGAFALASIQARVARAQAAPPAAVVPARRLPPPSNAPPSDDVVPRLDERTALTLGEGKLKLGILAFDYGITDWLSVGVSPPYWAARAVASVLVPNLQFKIVALQTRDLWIAANVGGYYAFVGKNDEARGEILTVPLSGFVSWQAIPRFWLHPELTYTFVNAFGTGDFSRFTLGGTAATRTVQLGLMLQYELTSVVSLTLLGRFQAYTGSVAISGNGSVDQFTSASVEGRITPGFQHPWEIIPGVALLWQHVRVVLGVGYGNYFLPGMDIAIRGAGFVPDGSIYFVL